MAKADSNHPEQAPDETPDKALDETPDEMPDATADQTPDNEPLDWERDLAEVSEGPWMGKALDRLKQQVPSEFQGRQWLVGDLLGGRYRLGRQLGQGGFGAVFEARDTVLNRDVAVKLLHPNYSLSIRHRQRFEHEARIASRTPSEHVVAVHTVETAEDGSLYLVMELVNGPPLSAFTGNGTAAPRKVAEWLCQAARGLAVAHSQGIVHRDIKTSNLLVDESGRLKVADFGLARVVEGETTEKTLSEEFAGSLPYMSPEQLATPGRVDQRTDIYSLGVVLYELLSASRPFRGTPPAIMRQIAESLPIPLRQLNPSCPRDLARIADKCLRKEPARRYQSAVELEDDLQRWLDHRPVKARPIGLPERTRRWCLRNRVLATLIFISLLAAVVSTSLYVSLLVEQRHLDRSLGLADQLLEGLATGEFRTIDDVYAQLLQGNRRFSAARRDALRQLFLALLDLQDATEAERRSATDTHRAVDFSLLSDADFRPDVLPSLNSVVAYAKVWSARRRLDRALELDPTLGIAWLLRAQIRMEVLGEDKQEVLADWNRAVELLPEAGVAHSGRGWCHLTLKQHEAARADLERALAIDSENELAHFGLALALEMLGEFEQAIPHYETAVQGEFKFMSQYGWRVRVAVDSSTAYWGAANRASENGDHDRAIRHTLRALAFCPAEHRPKLWNNLFLFATLGTPTIDQELFDAVRGLIPLTSTKSFVFAKELALVVLQAKAGTLDESQTQPLLERLQADPQVASEISAKCLDELREWAGSENVPEATRTRLQPLLDALQRVVPQEPANS